MIFNLDSYVLGIVAGVGLGFAIAALFIILSNR